MGNAQTSNAGMSSPPPPLSKPDSSSPPPPLSKPDTSSPPPPLSKPDTTALTPTMTDVDKTVTTSNTKSDNPGTMEELHKQCKDVFPITFEGGKFMINKPLSNHFQVSHTMNFSTLQPPGYKFSATYVGTEQISPSEAYPVILGEVDPSGNLNANIIHQLTPHLRTKFVAQIQQKKWQATQFTADYFGKNYTSSLTLGNLDVINNSGVAVFHYLQRVTKRIDGGAELAYQFGPQVPGGQVALHSFVGKYNGDKFTASGTVGLAGLHLCYYQRASDNLQFGVELETSLRMQESTASLAYQVDIPKANFTFKGTLDSNWTVGAVIEKKLLPLPFTFALSGTLNHQKNDFKIGCGFIIG